MEFFLQVFVRVFIDPFFRTLGLIDPDNWIDYSTRSVREVVRANPTNQHNPLPFRPLPDSILNYPKHTSLKSWLTFLSPGLWLHKMMSFGYWVFLRCYRAARSFFTLFFMFFDWISGGEFPLLESYEPVEGFPLKKWTNSSTVSSPSALGSPTQSPHMAMLENTSVSEYFESEDEALPCDPDDSSECPFEWIYDPLPEEHQTSASVPSPEYLTWVRMQDISHAVGFNMSQFEGLDLDSHEAPLLREVGTPFSSSQEDLFGAEEYEESEEYQEEYTEYDSSEEDSQVVKHLSEELLNEPESEVVYKDLDLESLRGLETDEITRVWENVLKKSTKQTESQENTTNLREVEPPPPPTKPKRRLRRKPPLKTKALTPTKMEKPVIQRVANPTDKPTYIWSPIAWLGLANTIYNLDFSYESLGRFLDPTILPLFTAGSWGWYGGYQGWNMKPKTDRNIEQDNIQQDSIHQTIFSHGNHPMNFSALHPRQLEYLAESPYPERKRNNLPRQPRSRSHLLSPYDWLVSWVYPQDTLELHQTDAEQEGDWELFLTGVGTPSDYNAIPGGSLLFAFLTMVIGLWGQKVSFSIVLSGTALKEVNLNDLR